jgi:glucosamine-6-phosphate deaminase
MERESMHVNVFNTAAEASKSVAQVIANTIHKAEGENRKCVLGLATGSTPKSVYAELIRLHKEEGLSFKNVVTFNLDEYYPMSPSTLQSYHKFMYDHLFSEIDIFPENIHIPDGTLKEDAIADFCDAYEAQIDALGGLDIQLLGIGRTGHIGFNEPGSQKQSRTRLITLDRLTKIDAASDFFGAEYVPSRAITMGVGTILKAKRIILLAWGESKSSIIQKTVEGPITEYIPATYLQEHRNTSVYLDAASSSELIAYATPWLVKPVKWTEFLIKKAVVWLSLKTGKPILKLTDNHYAENGLGSLLSERNGAYNINIVVFNQLQKTITGWPGGKPNEPDTYRPERALPMPKRAVIFSPHPDDDVISMGGTFKRLVDQGHEVHVAYQTSGNIAVFNDYVLQLVDLFDEISSQQQFPDSDLISKVKLDLAEQDPGESDSELIRNLKGLIRKCEARSGCRFVGIPEQNAHFLNLPFYETGLIKKNPIGKEDLDITVNLLRKLQPHQIFAAGDLSDPHGTHRVCLELIFQALDQCKNDSWIKDCFVWLYRGAWQEWPIEDIDMAVPLSPGEVFSKRKAIFKHQSQKDAPLFPGPDNREFWQRAEDRNSHTAHLYDQLGLAEYEAIEAFKRYYP